MGESFSGTDIGALCYVMLRKFDYKSYWPRKDRDI